MMDLYDKQFFKKAMINADEVLAKHKDHAETLAMKALILNGLKKKTEAYAMIQKALFSNMSNFSCWHVYGLLNKSHKKHDEARKAYLNALRYDSGNLNVLRDLSLLQVQLKDYEGFAESRRKIMQARPTELLNWTSYMVAVYLTGDYKTALEVFGTIEETINGIENAEKKPKPQEKNEIYLFKAKILEDS